MRSKTSCGQSTRAILFTATTTWRSAKSAPQAQERDDEAVPAGLRQHALARVDQDHREVGGRRAGRHVARVLLVARAVGDDELALVGGEVAVGDVDRDALLALGLEAVEQE